MKRNRFRLVVACFIAVVSFSSNSRAQGKSASKSTKTQQVYLSGNWGGQHLGVSATSRRASLAFDCAHGQINKPLRSNQQGGFAVRGVYVEEHGGPILKGEVPKSHPALYTGRVARNRMTLTVKLVDTGQLIGTFVARRGEVPRLFKCR